MKYLPLLMILTAPLSGAARQGAAGSGSQQGVALWIRDTRQWPGYENAGMVRLDTAALRMRVGDKRTLWPMVTGSPPNSNVYLDVCVPAEEFEVTPSRVWSAVEVEHWDCNPYSAYIPPAAGSAQAAPREPLRVRALTAGAFKLRYKIVTGDGPPVEGAFSIAVDR